jgi:hypothetical protein
MQPFDGLQPAAFLRPSGQHGNQSGASRGIRVLRCRDRGSTVDGSSNHLAETRHAPPVGSGGNFQVVDDDGEFRGLADLNGFTNSALDVEAFAANVRHVDALVQRRNAGERDQLVGVRKRSGRVDQGTRQPERARAHTRVDEFLHPSQLVRRGLSVVEAHHFPPRHRRRNQRADID